ncbi:MAG: hypothetical protein WDZ76_11345 [Pseudohongiellaceae bacterium]
MQFVHQFSLVMHAGIGAVALLLFWIPVIARKGSLNHRRFGRYFAGAMYFVAGSGLAMAGSDLLFPLASHGIEQSVSDEVKQRLSAEIRHAALFLFSLSILVLASTRQGWLVILHKRDRTALRAPAHLLLCGSLVLVGLLLLIVGTATGQPLFMGFAIVELIVGVNLIRYALKAELKPREWWNEHLGGLIGAGIGAYTAFFVFGGSRLLEEFLTGGFEGVMIIFWTGPGVIGGIAIALLSRHYTRRHDQRKPRVHPAIRRAGIRSKMFS